MAPLKRPKRIIKIESGRNTGELRYFTEDGKIWVTKTSEKSITGNISGKTNGKYVWETENDVTTV